MNPLFEISLAGEPDSPMVRFGPTDPNTGWYLEMPRRLTRRVRYRDLKLEVVLVCAFSGERLEIESMSIKGVSAYIATRNLTQLALPAVMAEIAHSAIPDASRWHQPLNEGGLNKITSPEYLTQMYWYRFVGWGAPRDAVQKYMGWSRANTNFHLKKFHAQFQLPGSHSMPKPRTKKELSSAG